ncbi:MAG: preprotein translocase subunit SecE [Firmicutes bacterium]|nr:preprotein translocase subunit SecE [Bacillota bacterium]
MGKDNLNLKLQENPVPVTAPPANADNQQRANKGGAKKKGQQKNAKPNIWQRFIKFCKEIISELKKVDWPPLKQTKNNHGVIMNTSIVLVVVAFFLVLITGIDLGLSALLRLITAT